MPTMFRSKFANQFAALAFSVILSASFLAYAIVPASPGLA